MPVPPSPKACKPYAPSSPLAWPETIRHPGEQGGGQLGTPRGLLPKATVIRHGMHARMMMVFRMIILAEQGIILSLRMIRGAIILISSR